MPDYKKMYHVMFNAATDAEHLASQAAEIPRKAQCECEEMFIESPDAPITLLPNDKAAEG